MARSDRSRLVVPADVLITPVGALSPEVRSKLDGQGSHALTRPWSRVPSKVLDADAAALVEMFRRPTRIVDAVLRFSRARGADPEETLVSAYPLLHGLVAAGLLVAHDSEEAAAIRASLEPGASAGPYRVAELVRLVSDTELYRATGPSGTPAAIKIARRASDERLCSRLEHEAGILATLGGEIAPRLLEVGEVEGRRYVAMEWVAGESIVGVAAEHRERHDRERLIEICRRLVDAYRHLHRRGVLHADVHPANTLCELDGTVRLVDFGLSSAEGSTGPRGRPERAGVIHFFEPEYARAALAGEAAPPPTAAGEQYALAALLFLLLTGKLYLDFALESRQILRQVVDQPPLGFAAAGANPWPEVEAVLARALRKDPAERYPSVADLSSALDDAVAGRRRSRRADGGLRDVDPAVRERASEILAGASFGGDLFLRGYRRGPVASLNYGSAGLAYALYRLSCLRESPDLLALADVWASRAVADVARPDAFYDPAIDLTVETVGPSSILHTAVGVYLTDALIAHCQGDAARRERSSRAFLSLAEVPTDELDLALGTAGILAGCATLFGAMPSAAARRGGDALFERLWASLGEPRSIAGSAAALNLGAAHGWAGVLFALLRWVAATGAPLPASVPALLDELRGLGEEAGAGLRWRWANASSGAAAGQYVSGWCNGSAGLVYLWSLAAEILDDDRWLEVAERAGWYAWQGREAPPNLCCGTVGSAYALLHLFRRTEQPIWLARAHDHLRSVAEHVGTLSDHPDSLFRGRLGFALLAAEIESPKLARMPIFESESGGRGGA